MARPRKKAEDLVPDESPLEEVAEAEQEVEATEAEAPSAEAETAAQEAAAEAPAAAEPAGAEPAAEEPAGEPPAEDPEPAEEPAAEASVEEPEAEAGEAPAVEAQPAEPAQPKEPAKPRRTRAERKARVRPKRRGRAQSGERKPIVRLPKPEHERGRRKERRGVVVSSAMDKTIVVRVETAKPDRRYKKVVRRSTKFHAHDERNEANVGDHVRIVETRPLSKTKTWRLAEVVQAAE